MDSEKKPHLCTLFLVRHACTEGNEKRQYVGRTDEPLSAAGLAQAFAARAAFAACGAYVACDAFAEEERPAAQGEFAARVNSAAPDVLSEQPQCAAQEMPATGAASVSCGSGAALCCPGAVSACAAFASCVPAAGPVTSDGCGASASCDSGTVPAEASVLCPPAVPVPVQAVFTSPMRRCRETAALLFPGVPQIVIEDLRETDFGRFEGKTYEQLKDDADYRAWVDSAGETCAHGGEGGAAFRARCEAAFARVAQRIGAAGLQSAAVVAHGGTLMAILARYARPAAGFYAWQTPNAAGWRCVLDCDALILCGPERVPRANGEERAPVQGANKR